MHNTMQMTLGGKNGSEWSPSHTKSCTRQKGKKKKQQATTKICCEISKDPHPLSNMGNKKAHIERGKGLSGRVGSWLEK